MLDVFSDNAFSLTELTAAVNAQPFVPGQVGNLGIYQWDGVYTTDLVIEEQKGVLTLVAPSPRGGPGETIPKEGRKIRKLMIPHLQRDDAVMAEEVQGVRAFGTENQVESVLDRVVERSMIHFRDFDATREHMMVGGIKGVVLDKNGSVIHNLFNEFNVAAPDPVYFNLDDATPESGVLRDTCDTIIETIEDELGAGTYDHIHAICGRQAYKKLFRHPEVIDSYLNTVEAAFLRQGLPRTFPFGDITFERYRTGSGLASFIDDDEIRFFPVGTSGLFLGRFAPADYNETVNTKGLPRYAKVIEMRNGKGYDLEVQSNPIVVCTRPRVLIKGLAGADPG